MFFSYYSHICENFKFGFHTFYYKADGQPPLYLVIPKVFLIESQGAYQESEWLCRICVYSYSSFSSSILLSSSSHILNTVVYMNSKEKLIQWCLLLPYNIVLVSYHKNTQIIRYTGLMTTVTLIKSKQTVWNIHFGSKSKQTSYYIDMTSSLSVYPINIKLLWKGDVCFLSFRLQGFVFFELFCFSFFPFLFPSFFLSF